MKNKKYYTQLEVDEYVRKLLTDSEITLSKQSERIEKEMKINEQLSKELEEYKKKEKAISRMLILSERKAKFLESTTRSRCAIETERLARLVDKWDEFFNDLNNRYQVEDKEKFDEFKQELEATIDSMIEIGDLLTDKPLSEAEQAHLSEINRLNVMKNKKQSELDGRFSKLVQEFNMKIGDNATRGRGRPKKDSIVSSYKTIESQLNKSGKKKSDKNYPPVGENGFDFNEALNPTDSLEDIMKDLMGDVNQ